MDATGWEIRLARRWPQAVPRRRCTLANLLATATDARLRRAVVVLSKSEPLRPVLLTDYVLSRSELRRLRSDSDFAGVVSGAEIKALLGAR